MKNLFLVAMISISVYACGPSSSTGNENNGNSPSIDVSSSPTGDTAITDGGTRAAKGAETKPRTDSATNR